MILSEKLDRPQIKGGRVPRIMSPLLGLNWGYRGQVINVQMLRDMHMHESGGNVISNIPIKFSEYTYTGYYTLKDVFI